METVPKSFGSLECKEEMTSLWKGRLSGPSVCVHHWKEQGAALRGLHSDAGECDDTVVPRRIAVLEMKMQPMF